MLVAAPVEQIDELQRAWTVVVGVGVDEAQFVARLEGQLGQRRIDAKLDAELIAVVVDGRKLEGPAGRVVGVLRGARNHAHRLELDSLGTVELELDGRRRVLASDRLGLAAVLAAEAAVRARADLVGAAGDGERREPEGGEP